MTSLPMVFADGSSMPPHFVVKGEKRLKWWGSPESNARIEYPVYLGISISACQRMD
jgi:hypothetical protein